MTFTQLASTMWPFWFAGLMVLILTFFTKHRSLIRVEKKAVVTWAKGMSALFGFRMLLFFILLHFFKDSSLAHMVIKQFKSLMFLPWQGMLFVFWEDAVHVLPLIILRSYAVTHKWVNFLFYPLLGLVMFDFGLGHSYEGLLAVAMMAVYIPVTMKIGKKYGVGTTMVCHTMYDLATFAAIKLALMI